MVAVLENERHEQHDAKQQGVAHEAAGICRREGQLFKEPGIEQWGFSTPFCFDEEEEQVDIAKVASELKSLEVDMKETDETIEGFCKELNIPTPF